jgi:DNA polymerase I-like protein with 3'-5' exonuclease and polymerase domains
VYLVASVHDSVMFEVPEVKAEEVARYVQRVMVETARKYANWYVPVDVEVGPRWEEITHKLTSAGVWKKEEQKAA